MCVRVHALSQPPKHNKKVHMYAHRIETHLTRRVSVCVCVFMFVCVLLGLASN